MKYAKRKQMLMLVMMVLIGASASYAQSSAESTPKSPANIEAHDTETVIVAGCEKAAKEVVASRDYIAHLEGVKTDYEQTMALMTLKMETQAEAIVNSKSESASLREALKAEREVSVARLKEVESMRERVANLERRKGGGLKEKIVTIAIGAAIGAVLK